MVKFRLYYDKDAEEKWLNEMAAEGWAMTGFFAGFYTFEQCEKGKWSYQIDFGEKLGRVTEDYRQFMTEAGIEIVQCWGYWIILRKPAAEGEFQLYTDVESSLEHYSKILTMFKIGAALELLIFAIQVYGALNGSYVAAICAFIILAVVVVFMNAVARTKGIINELKARQSGIEPDKSRGISPVLAAGLLCNSCGILARNSTTIPDPVSMTVQIFAIVLMLIGVYRTAAGRKK